MSTISNRFKQRVIHKNEEKNLLAEARDELLSLVVVKSPSPKVKVEEPQVWYFKVAFAPYIHRYSNQK